MKDAVLTRLALIDSAPDEQIHGNPERWITTAVLAGNLSSITKLSANLRQHMASAGKPLSRWSSSRRKSDAYKQAFNQALDLY